MALDEFRDMIRVKIVGETAAKRHAFGLALLVFLSL